MSSGVKKYFSFTYTADDAEFRHDFPEVPGAVWTSARKNAIILSHESPRRFCRGREGRLLEDENPAARALRGRPLAEKIFADVSGRGAADARASAAFREDVYLWRRRAVSAVSDAFLHRARRAAAPCGRRLPHGGFLAGAGHGQPEHAGVLRAYRPASMAGGVCAGEWAGGVLSGAHLPVYLPVRPVFRCISEAAAGHARSGGGAGRDGVRVLQLSDDRHH